MLTIVKATDPVLIQQLNLCIYGPPGLGKTSLGFTAEDPLNLDFNRGVHRAVGRRDSVAINKWQDVEGMNAIDLAPYRSVIVDTAGDAVDMLALDITAKDPKMGNGLELTLKGFGALKRRFSNWLKFLNSLGKDVVLICHMDEQKQGDSMRERLDVMGSAKGQIYKSTDAMGRLIIREERKDGKVSIKRYLDFSPREGSFGKNPAALDEIEVAHPTTNPDTLAQIISITKAKINQLSAEQQEMLNEVQRWMQTIDTLAALSDFNGMLAQIPNAPAGARDYFKKRARAFGFRWNNEGGAYESPAAAAPNGAGAAVLHV